jgi:hypothetical protein
MTRKMMMRWILHRFLGIASAWRWACTNRLHEIWPLSVCHWYLRSSMMFSFHAMSLGISRPVIMALHSDGNLEARVFSSGGCPSHRKPHPRISPKPRCQHYCRLVSAHPQAPRLYFSVRLPVSISHLAAIIHPLPLLTYYSAP